MIKREISEIIPENMMQYSAYVLLNRAIPDLRDGLKPVQRRILWAMFHYKDFKFTKSANVTGQVMRFHPHGSSYDTIVNMTQKDRNNIPYIIGKGNFGQKTSKNIQYAADRYTEVKISELALDMIKDYKNGSTKMIPNYDNTLMLPEVFPVKFPTILTNENSGIAVGYSSSIPSFNLNEIVAAIELYLKTGKETFLYPDFATGGFIVENESNLEKINTEGSGSLVLRGAATIEKNEIIINSIPFTTTREAIIEKITTLYKQGKLKEVNDIHDLTGLKGLNITIAAKRNTDMELLLEKIYKLTPLETSYSANMNVLYEGLPVKLGVWGILKEWLQFRIESIEKILNHKIRETKKQMLLFEGLEKVESHMQEVIQIVRFSVYEEINEKLMITFDLNEEQAKYIAGLSLRNMNQSYISSKINELGKFKDLLKSLNDDLNNRDYINEVIVSDLKESAKKYGKDRKTTIIKPLKVDVKEIIDSTIEDYEAFLYVTEAGYLYKFKEQQLLKDINMKQNDKIIHKFKTNNKAVLILIDDQGISYKANVNDVPITRKSSLGSFYKQVYVKYTPGNIVAASVLDDDKKYMIIAYDNNRISKIDIQAAYNNSRMILKNSFNTKATPIKFITLEKDTVLTVTTPKTKVEVNTSDLKTTANKNATGVYANNEREMKRITSKEG